MNGVLCVRCFAAGTITEAAGTDPSRLTSLCADHLAAARAVLAALNAMPQYGPHVDLEDDLYDWGML